MASPTVLAWLGAGRPAVPECTDTPAGRCYWCGVDLHGLRATGRDWLPDSFPAHNSASVKASTWICEPCCWSMGQRNALPTDYALERIARKADVGRRSDVLIVGETEPRKVLVLRLASGRVGLWTTGKNASQEEAWTKRAAELRASPVDVGACRFLGDWPIEDLRPSPTERMQSYHHFATAHRWWPVTDTDKAAIRAWLLEPPDEPWVGAISDGKKHGLPFSRPSSARAQGLQTVYFLGDIIDYAPERLGALVHAVERLIAAGANDEEIETGRYPGRDLAFAAVHRQHEPTCRRHRGSPLMSLALYLRRGRKELTDV